MKAEISTDNMFLVNQDTGEKISLKGVKQIDTEELTFTGKGFKTNEKFKRLMDVEVRKQQLYGMYERMKRNIEIAELMGWRTIESEIAIKCIMTELEMLGVDIKHIKEMVL